MTDILVESYRQASGGIIFPAQRFSYGRATFFAGIPRIENCIGVLVGPVHRERAAIHEDDDQRLAGCGECFEQVLLGLGKIKAGAVAAFKSLLAHRHLLAFEFAGNSDDCDHHVRIFRGGNCLGRGPSIRLCPDELCLHWPRFCTDVVHFERNLRALSQMNATDLGLRAMRAEHELLRNRLAVNRNRGRRAIRAHAQVVIAGFGWRQKPVPLNVQGIFSRGLRRNVLGFELKRPHLSAGKRHELASK